MKVSVIIPNYNDQRIARAVRSVTQQTHPHVELLIMDGGSTDPVVLDFYDGCDSGVVHSEPDRGLFDALNKGVARATGEVLYLMGADDELSGRSVVADVVAELAANPTLHGVCIGCELVSRSGRTVRSWYPRSVSTGRMKVGILPPHFSLFLRRQVYEAVGPFRFDEVGHAGCDSVWLMDCVLAIDDLRIAVLPQHHLRMDLGGASTGSLRGIARQFRTVHNHARAVRAELPAWYTFALVKTLSKLLQLRLPARRGTPGTR
jgi:glycosyltransferase involved in cell wall biosynthesis